MNSLLFTLYQMSLSSDTIIVVPEIEEKMELK